MSLANLLTAWIEPFLPHHAAALDAEERKRRQEQQAREAEVLLRQIRAELKLMRRWRDSERDERQHDG